MDLITSGPTLKPLEARVLVFTGQSSGKGVPAGWLEAPTSYRDGHLTYMQIVFLAMPEYAHRLSLIHYLSDPLSFSCSFLYSLAASVLGTIRISTA